MAARANEEAGIGLVELLVAMTVLAIGIFALVAGFSSGFGAINRASKTSTAGTIADKEMEAYRRGSYTSIASWADTRSGADGRTYWVVSTVTPSVVCSNGVLATATTCDASHGGWIGREVKTVKITVHDGPTASDPPLITQSSTYDQSIG